MSRELADRPIRDCCLFCGTVASEGQRGDRLCPCCESPLEPAERPGHEPLGAGIPFGRQRRPLEIYANWPLTDPIEATLTGFSSSGLEFSAAVAFEPGRLLKIDCELFKALARVTHSRAGAPGRYIAAAELEKMQKMGQTPFSRREKGV